uniref:Uncharacterized protein n=1 Tax=Penaeus monodon nucleopolyhedrovirus TaxID=259389 RepID=A9LMF4_9BACU|nr:hypothetical protein [Penaeus monodon nucleopolyhedrovirus]
MTSLGGALNIEKYTNPQAVQDERTKNQPKGVDTVDNSDYLYPTIIMVPLIIVFVTILCISVSLITKLVLIFFLIVVIVALIMYFKKINIAAPLKNYSELIKLNTTNNRNQSLHFAN